ncbi:MAG: putative porin [Bacteroidota bacterium]
MKKSLVFLFLVFAVQLYGQGDLFLNGRDTLRIDSRTGGKELDSVADYHSGTLVLTPGSYAYSPFGRYQASYEQFMPRLNSPFLSFSKQPFYFSAMPHLGFMYTFGSKGLQMLQVDYQQFFSKKFGVNLTYSRSSMGEMMRQDNFKHNDFRFSTRFISGRYKNYNQFFFQKSELNQNGGLDTNGSVLEFSLEFLKVRKAAAYSQMENLRAEAEHYLNFLDDSLRGIGLFVHNQWTINNRVYVEIDQLDTVYSQVNIDTFNTRDQFQFAKIFNSAGIYLQTKKFFGQFSAGHAYWDYQNLGMHRDTVELSLSGSLRYELKGMTFSNRSYFNLVGAVGEKSSESALKIDLPKYLFTALLDYREKLPELQQRSYFANNFSWTTPDLQTQKYLAAGAGLRLKGKIGLEARLRYQLYHDYYFFTDSLWRNDTLSTLQLMNLNLKADLRYKALLFQPMVIVNRFSKELAFLPVVDVRARLAFQHKIFKSQKLDFLAGVDVAYQGSRKLLDYVNALDVFVLSASGNKTNPDLYKVDFFTAFQIETFRFYIKAENLDYLWNRTDSFVAVNIPVTPFYLRIGLTWDFFN